MGIRFPWDDDCDDTVVINGAVYKLIQGPNPTTNVLFGAYAEWTCVYQAQAGGNVITETHHRVLWIFDF